MNDNYMEFNFLDVDDDSFLGENEEIICRHCKLISYVEFSSEEDQEVIDFSNYNFQTNEGFVLWSCYYTEEGIDELTINSDCMVSQQFLDDGTSEFYWWPAGTITFYKE